MCKHAHLSEKRITLNVNTCSTADKINATGRGTWRFCRWGPRASVGHLPQGHYGVIKNMWRTRGGRTRTSPSPLKGPQAGGVSDYCCDTKSLSFSCKQTRHGVRMAIRPCFEWATNKLACAGRPQAAFVARYQEASPYLGQDILVDLAPGTIL